MTEFEKYTELVKNGEPIKTVSDDEKLEFYGLYKQSIIGNVNTMRPDGLFNFEAKAKWDVWEKNKDISKELAKEKYIIKAKIYFK